MIRWSLLFAAIFLSNVLPPGTAQADPVNVKSSTQFLWGDDLLGEHQAIIAQYLRLNYSPDGKPYSFSGYGRIWADLSNGKVRSDEGEGRLYYLYMDYSPFEDVTARIGRHYTFFTSAASPILDGATINIHNIAKYIGVTLAGGWEVRYTLDSEFERDKDYMAGIDVHLENVRSVQAGISYARKYRSGDLAREELGMNFRYFFKSLSPYADVKYDLFTTVFDEATLGVDFFPMQNLLIKAEFYHSYPTFDAESIYSVFAVDRYREYLIRAEYSLTEPVTIFGGYTRQDYQEGKDADVFTVGTKVTPLKDLNVTGCLNFRTGYSGYNGLTGSTNGKLYGFELYADYRLRKELIAFAGIQYDTYKRPELETGDDYATRFWGGARWLVTKNMIINARLEDNVNQSFDHRILGRVSLDWNL